MKIKILRKSENGLSNHDSTINIEVPDMKIENFNIINVITNCNEEYEGGLYIIVNVDEQNNIAIASPLEVITLTGTTIQ